MPSEESYSPPPQPVGALSLRQLLVAIGAALLLGIAAAWSAARYTTHAQLPWWGAILALPSIYIGTEITSRTKSWLGSLAGHLLAMLSIGVLLGTILPSTDSPAHHVLRIVAWGILGFTLVLAAWPGLIHFPATFLVASAIGIGGAVSTHTLPMIVSDIPVWPVLTSVAVLWYIDRYWSLAATRDRTLDAAIDTACALYLDPIARGFALTDRLIPSTRR